MKFLLIAILLLNLVMPVFPFEPSGGVLSLDGIDDYAIYPFAEHGYLFEKNTREFTVEMWFYPKAGPRHSGSNIILSQQVYFGLTSHRGKCKDRVGNLCCYGGAYLDGEKVHGVMGVKVPVERDRWNYVAIIYKDSKFGFAYNDRIYRKSRVALVDRVSAEVRGRPKDFFVGGYAQELVLFRGAPPITRFHGDIDAIRFSKVARYDLPDLPWVEDPFDPPHRFSMDRDTVALWNFDEREGANRFQDETREKRTLIGVNGASVGKALAVEANDKMSTRWAEIKALRQSQP